MAYIFSFLFSLIGIFGAGILGFANGAGGWGAMGLGMIGAVIVIVAVPISLFSWLMTWAFRDDVSSVGYSALWLNAISILILVMNIK